MNFKRGLAMLAAVALLALPFRTMAAVTYSVNDLTGPYATGGNTAEAHGYLNLAGTYATGGVTITARDFGMSYIQSLIVEGEDGYMLYYDGENKKLMMFQTGTLTPDGTIGDAGGFTPSGTVSQPTFTGTAFAAATALVMDDDSAGTTGTAVWLMLDDGKMEEAILASENASAATAQLDTDEGLSTFVVYKPLDDEIVNVTDDDSASSNGTALYFRWNGQGVDGILTSANANNANVTFTCNDGGDTVPVPDDDNAALAGSVAIYFDEDATDGNRFLAITPTGLDSYVQTTVGRWLKITYAANPSGSGVQVYFNDDAANSYERLLFVSPTDTDGTNTNDSATAFSAVEDVTMVAVYFDEDGTAQQRFMQTTSSAVDIAVPFVDLTDPTLSPRLLNVVYDATASSNVAVYFDDDAVAVDERLLFVSPTDTDGTDALNAAISYYAAVDVGAVSQPTFAGAIEADHTHSWAGTPVSGAALTEVGAATSVADVDRINFVVKGF